MSPNRTRFVLHATVSGNTPRPAGMDKFSAGNPVERRLNRIERVAAAYGGTIKERGDDLIWIHFTAADAALFCACEMQHRCAALPQLSGQPLALRIGIHHGLLHQRAQDNADDTAEIASTLAALDDGIVVSGDFAAGLNADLRKILRPLRLPNIEHPVLQADWRSEIPSSAYGGESRWPASTHPSASRGRRALLQCGLKTVELTPAHPVVTVGRDPQNDLVLADDRISRHHARIELRDKETVLIDESTNGTSVQYENGAEFLVRKDAFPLKNKGLIFFGRSSDGDRRGGIRFEIL